MPYKVINGAYSTLASELTDSATVITVAAGTGSRFNVGSDYTYATLEDVNGNVEIVRITEQFGDMLTVVRGQDGTVARTWPVGAIIEVRPCAIAINDIQNQTKTLAVSAAAAYTDSTSANTLLLARAYADGVGSDTLSQARSYANGIGSSFLLQAKAYTQTYAAPKGDITSSGLTQTNSGLLGRTSGGSGNIEEIQVVGATLNNNILLVHFYDVFHKVDPTTVAFVKTGNNSAAIKAGTKISVGNKLVEFASQTDIIMPALTPGANYVIWVKDDGSIQANTDFINAPSVGSWRKIGGFHYAPGSNALGQSGGNDTPQINEYSFWDLKFRPSCPDPRGMTLVANSFWADIYLLCVDHLTFITSQYNAVIADGSNPPKRPLKFGGNGDVVYSSFNWWNACEVMRSHGKRLPTYSEFVALAYGATEAMSSGGSDVLNTGINGVGTINDWYNFTSAWGVIQATGCMFVWGSDFGGSSSSEWVNINGRGAANNLPNVAIFGGAWDSETNSGSYCSDWSKQPTYSAANISARGVANHLLII